MKVYILDTGWLECDANMMVSGEVTGTLGDPHPRVKWIKIPVYAVLIDMGENKILFDTGCPKDAMNGYWPTGLKNLFPYYYNEEQTLERQLSLVGVKPSDINTVVLSHMHLDHAGNLGLFKDAEVYVHKKDFEYGLTLVHLSSDPEKHGAYIKQDLETQVRQYHLGKRILNWQREWR